MNEFLLQNNPTFFGGKWEEKTGHPAARDTFLCCNMKHTHTYIHMGGHGRIERETERELCSCSLLLSLKRFDQKRPKQGLPFFNSYTIFS